MASLFSIPTVEDQAQVLQQPEAPMVAGDGSMLSPATAVATGEQDPRFHMAAAEKAHYGFGTL